MELMKRRTGGIARRRNIRAAIRGNDRVQLCSVFLLLVEKNKIQDNEIMGIAEGVEVIGKDKSEKSIQALRLGAGGNV